MREIRRLRHSRQLIEDTFQKPGKQQASSPRRPIAQSKSRKLWISHTIDDRHNAENCVYSLQHKLTTHFLRVYLKHRLAPGCREKVHSQRADIGREFCDLTCPPAYCTHQCQCGGGGGATWRHLLTHWLPPQTPQRRCFTPRSL